MAGFFRVLGSFGAIQIMQLLLPLLALPWLGRILGPEAFGLLMYLCLLPPLVALLMDWGLAYGGSRKAAHLRGDKTGLAELLGAALATKIILALICALLALCLWPVLPHARSFPLAYSLAIMAGMMRGLSPAWFYQGIGVGMPRVAAWDAGASFVTLALVILLIRSSEQWSDYLAFLAITKGIAYGWLTFGLCREYRPNLSWCKALSLIKHTTAFFGSAFSLMICYNGGQLCLGLFLSAADMGMIVAVNKMLRALASLINPFTQTLFPELCILHKADPHRCFYILRWSVCLAAIASLACTALVWLLASFLIKIALGTQYGPAASVLRIAILAAPFMVCNNVLANQGLAPFGKEKAQLGIQAGCALLSFPLAALLGTAWGLTGGAFLPVCLEAAMSAAFTIAVIKLYHAND